MKNTFRKRWLFLFITLLLSFIVVGCDIFIDSSTIDSDTTDSTPTYIPLHILTINDLHGYIEQDDDGRYGLSNMAYLIDEIRNQDNLDNVVLIGNGDMFQGTFISNETYGLSVIDAMNAMGFDAMGIGNHEFDWGIEKILQYFDGNPDNGEANFPLLNANIYNRSDNSLLTIEDGNVLESIVIEKQGIEVGIISYIGDVYDSISYNMVSDYYFNLDIAGSVKRIGSKMKSDGVDVIIVNIHDGNRSKIENFQFNKQLAKLKDDEGNYIVDAVINGHAHWRQTGEIIRLGGSPMPLVQAGSYGTHFGHITLHYNVKTKRIVETYVDIVDVKEAGYNYHESVEKISQEYVDKLGNEPLIEAGETIHNTDQFYGWIGNVMLKATGSDIAYHNNGGVRGTGSIVEGEDVTISQIFEIVPFNNSIFVFEATYEEIISLENDSLFRQASPNFEPGVTYQVAVISYVFYNYDEFKSFQNRGIDTELLIRDLLVEDLKERARFGELFKPYRDHYPFIEQKWFPDHSFVQYNVNSYCEYLQLAV